MASCKLPSFLTHFTRHVEQKAHRPGDGLSLISSSTSFLFVYDSLKTSVRLRIPLDLGEGLNHVDQIILILAGEVVIPGPIRPAQGDHIDPFIPRLLIVIPSPSP
jgi:hypothetical protein